MEVTALCSRMFLILGILFPQVQIHYCAQNHGLAFPQVLPNRLQFFHYESISVDCKFDGSAGWRVMRKLKKESVSSSTSSWVTSAGSGNITAAFPSDSGEYWCEDGGGLRSNTVNITVTAGSVILESPVLPVKEGDNVTLSCRKKKSSATHIADFYKDGLLMKRSYERNWIIKNISTSDEGLYKCSISGAGESPESWLTVRDIAEETPPPQTYSATLLTTRWVVGTIFLVAMLLVLGVLHCRRQS